MNFLNILEFDGTANPTYMVRFERMVRIGSIDLIPNFLEAEGTLRTIYTLFLNVMWIFIEFFSVGGIYRG